MEVATVHPASSPSIRSSEMLCNGTSTLGDCCAGELGDGMFATSRGGIVFERRKSLRLLPRSAVCRGSHCGGSVQSVGLNAGCPNASQPSRENPFQFGNANTAGSVGPGAASALGGT